MSFFRFLYIGFELWWKSLSKGMVRDSLHAWVIAWKLTLKSSEVK